MITWRWQTLARHTSSEWGHVEHYFSQVYAINDFSPHQALRPTVSPEEHAGLEIFTRFGGQQTQLLTPRVRRLNS